MMKKYVGCIQREKMCGVIDICKENRGGGGEGEPPCDEKILFTTDIFRINME